MQSLILIVHVALAIGVIGLVLIQHGKGADAGAAFGSGASSTVFGSRGSASFLTKMTTLLAALFFVSSLALFYLAANRDRGTGSVIDALPAAVQESASETDAPPSDVPRVDGQNVDIPQDDAPPTPKSGSDAQESDLPTVNDAGTEGTGVSQ